MEKRELRQMLESLSKYYSTIEPQTIREIYDSHFQKNFFSKINSYDDFKEFLFDLGFLIDENKAYEILRKLKSDNLKVIENFNLNSFQLTFKDSSPEIVKGGKLVVTYAQFLYWFKDILDISVRTEIEKSFKDLDALLGYEEQHNKLFEELEIKINPGSAPPEIIAGVLKDLSMFYRRIGGSGLEIKPNNVSSLSAIYEH